MLERVTKYSLDHPKTVIGLVILLTALFGSQFPKITIDTDPENMREPDQPEQLVVIRGDK